MAGVDVVAERKKDKKLIHLGSTNNNGRLSTYLEEGKYKFISHKEGYKDWDKGKKIKKNKDSSDKL